MLSLSPHPLFGGAINTSIPSHFIDASEIRQVPDNQEVWLDPDDETSLIVELLEPIDAEDGIDAHFEVLAQDNEASSSRIILKTDVHSDLGPAHLLIGLQQAKKFNDESQVMVILGLIRLNGADIVITLNTPCDESLVAQLEAQPHRRSRNLEARRRIESARGIVERAIMDFKILDWGLFVT